MALTGIWSAHETEGSSAGPFGVLTQAPNGTAGSSERMPVVVPVWHYGAWLFPRTPLVEARRIAELPSDGIES